MITFHSDSLFLIGLYALSTNSVLSSINSLSPILPPFSSSTHLPRFFIRSMDPINFFKGHPTIDLLPNSELAASFNKILHKDYSESENDAVNRPPLQYGSDPGNYQIRKCISEWSCRKFNRPAAHPDTFNLTNGSSYGAMHILATCTDQEITKHAFLVSPTYFLINYVFHDFGFEGKMSSILETPNQNYDIDLVLLELKLAELNEKYGFSEITDKECNLIESSDRGLRKIYRYVMYLVPTFSNPGGLTYSRKTRIKLLEIARKNDLLIISDDVYDFLGYNSQVPELKITHLDKDTLPPNFQFGNSVSNASFSKIIAPGLRVGWHETVTEKLAQQLSSVGAVKSGGTPSQLNTFVVQDLIESGQLNDIIEGLIKVYSSRSKVMLAALQANLPSNHTKVFGGDGGYFVWVEVKGEGVDLAETIKIVKERYNVIIADGSEFEVAGDPQGWGKTHARLCVSLLSEKEIKNGIELWGEVIKEKYPHLYVV